MASFEMNEIAANNGENVKDPLVIRQNISKSCFSQYKYWILLLSVFLIVGIVIGALGASMIISSAVDVTSSEPKGASTTNDAKEQKPKNLIVIVSDGMGQNYNAAYRAYKHLDETVIDKHFRGRYSTTPTNNFGITDSAAGAVCFASGVQSHNSFLGIDGKANPKGSILAAAKRQGKGTGIVVTKSVTDATPAAFTAHSMYRSWNEMISKQQATRQINGEPMLDILFGGGRRYFERWGFFQDRNIWHDEYGWNKVISDGAEFMADLDNIDPTEMPFMGLFCDNSCPYYLDRIHGEIMKNDSKIGITQYPNLIDMSTKAINLLSTKYEQEGFFLMIEASRVDSCGHNNDIVCTLTEMEEFMYTTEYVLNWAEEHGETLVVMLSDHETGGLTIGRDGSYYSSEIIKYWDGTSPRNLDPAEAWAYYDYDYSIAPPSSAPTSLVEHYGAYKFLPDIISGSIHTADWFAEETRDGGSITTIEELFIALESMYIAPHKLTGLERNFLAQAFGRSTTTKRKAIVAIMNARTLAGWTTHGHTGADCAVYASGPGEEEFCGHWMNYEIGQLLSEVFDVSQEQNEETEYMEDLFVNGELKICDASIKPSYIEWENFVAYPEGNLLYPDTLCVDQWV